MPSARVRDIEIHYEIGGEEDAAGRLLFIGGTGGDLRDRPNVFDGSLAPASSAVSR